MKLVLLQIDIQWGNPQENIARVERLLSQATDANLYVLPEMWATGFATEPAGIAENESHSVALAWMKQQARLRGCAICGSLAVKMPDGSFRNRHYFVKPEGVEYYDKHHLFSHGGEDKTFEAGQEHTIVEWKGVRFLLLTCYDLRFPVWSRYGRAGEYDAIIYVANWPASRQLAWDVLTHARAIENQCYVIAVNRVGSDQKTSYQGGSMLIDPIGRTVAESIKNTEQALEAVLSMENLEKARLRFQVLSDRDE